MNNTVAKVMGYDAVWIPSNGSMPAGYTARVLFSNPTKSTKLSGVEYNPFDWQMEYHKEYFPGLKLSTDSGVLEVVTVNGLPYQVRSVITNWDGDTSLAKLEAN